MRQASTRSGRKARILATTAMWLSFAAPTAVLAQTAPPSGPDDDAAHVEDVVVTGTSIRGVAPVGSSVRPIGQEELQATGVVSTADIVRALPQFISLGAQEGQGGTTQNAAANVTQGTGINLRGLGTGSTLVLLNGRRLAPSGVDWQFNDVGMFPSGALQRVEVVPDGASAIYGSDAIAGVVNFIFQTRFDGAKTTVSAGAADGVDQWTVGQTFGKVWDSGDVFFAYEHFDRGPLAASDRDFLSADLRPFGGPDRRVNFSNPGTIVVSGVTYAIPRGQNGVGLTAGQLVAGTSNLSDPAATRDYLADQERDSFVFSARQNIGDRLQVSYDGFYGKRAFLNRGGSSVGAASATAALSVVRTNPFFVHPTNPAATSVTVNYDFSDVFPSYSHGEEISQQNAVGFKLDLFRDWVLDGYASANRASAQRRAEGQLRTVNLASVLGDANPATAFNPFGDHNVQNAATVARLNGFSDLHTSYKLNDYSLKISGSLFELPGGPVRAALGTEIYDATGYSHQERNTTTADPVVTLNSTVSRDVKAGFAEIFVPIVGEANAMPFVQRLELSVAGRYEEYSDFGNTTNPKIGLRWDPIADLSLRASYGTSFRAPTLKDIDAGGSGTYNVVDFIDPQSTAPNGLTHGIELLGGRPGIAPEEAETVSFGGDYKPSYVPGLRLSATWYKIDYSNRIDTLPYATTLANPTLLAQYIIRNPTPAQLTEIYNSPFYKGTPEPFGNFTLIVDSRRKNLGGFKQTGLDLSTEYSFANDLGDWRLRGDFTKILEAETALLPGATFVDTLDTINNPISTRVRASAGWSGAGGWAVDGFINFVGGYDNNVVTPVAQIDSWTTYDLTVAYTFEDQFKPLEGVRVALSAQNLFDTDPPVVINGLMAFDPANASALGRFVNFTVSKSW
jgi:iron complex outermembrane receptor protein